MGASAAAELYDPASGTWTSVGSMTTPRDYAASVPLADGRAFVVGGSARRLLLGALYCRSLRPCHLRMDRSSVYEYRPEWSCGFSISKR